MTQQNAARGQVSSQSPSGARTGGRRVSPYLVSHHRKTQSDVSTIAAGWVLALVLCFGVWVWIFRVVFSVIAP